MIWAASARNLPQAHGKHPGTSRGPGPHPHTPHHRRARHRDTQREQTRIREASLTLKCETLHPNLDEDDKNILVDGAIEVYSSIELTRKNLIGEVTVQVKGTTNKLKTNQPVLERA